MAPLKIAFVPEHFSTPLHFATKYFNLTATLLPYPAGTGAMISALRAGEVDLAIGLTEGWIAGLGTKKETSKKEGGYKIVGTYVETPLCWAIVTGRNRSELNGIKDLDGGNCGISRFGSGSHIMASVLLHQNKPASLSKPFSFTPLENFAKLRNGVAKVGDDSTTYADFFMWETFTCSRYTSESYKEKDAIKKIGEIYTPWSSWLIVAANSVLESKKGEVDEILQKINQGVEYFNGHQEEAVEYISTELDYSAEDAKAWLGTVRFAKDVKGVSDDILTNTIETLRTAGVLDEEVDLAAEKASMTL